MSLRAGTKITPSIRLKRLLGRGGMGTVWIADHQSLGTEVAVKLILGGLDADRDAHNRFMREAKAAARIRDPHIVQIFDQGVMQDGTPFLVMELLEGELLADYLERLGVVGLGEASMLVTQTAGALNKAHRLGVVHRDIKPENLFLTRAGGSLFVKILDFGIAKQHGPEKLDAFTTAQGAILGTPAYMSPEQLLDSKGAGPSGDVWSLAVVAYEMLTGQLPFDGETFAALNLAICSARYPAATALRPELPAALDDFFARAFCLEHEHRLVTAVELANGFKEACGASAAAVPSLDAEPPPAISKGKLQVSAGGPSLMSTTTTVRVEPRRQRRLALAVLAVVCPLAAGAWWWVTADGNEAPLLKGDSPTSASDPGSRPDVEETAVASVATSSAALDAGTAPSAQATDRTAAPDPVAPPTAWRPSPKPDCTDPFVIDDQGIKRVRRECL